MVNKIIRVISAIISILVFSFFIKLFYFDTNIGYDTQVLGFTYYSLPKCIYAFFNTLFIPIIVYFALYTLLNKLVSYNKT